MNVEMLVSSEVRCDMDDGDGGGGMDDVDCIGDVDGMDCIGDGDGNVSWCRLCDDSRVVTSTPKPSRNTLSSTKRTTGSITSCGSNWYRDG